MTMLLRIVTKTPQEYIRVHTSNIRVHTSTYEQHTSNTRVHSLSRGYDLRDSETDLKLPKPRTNFLKRSLNIVRQLYGTTFQFNAKNATTMNEFKRLLSNLPFHEAT